ncbi:MAG: SMI1/KNR4 family protein [Bacteroidota bacterium]
MMNDTTTESLQKEFEQLIQYYIDKGELHQKAEEEVRSFAKYLLGQTAYTKERLQDIIKTVNYETIKRHEDYKVWPELELWRGIGDFGSAAALNYDGDVDMLEEENIVLGEYHDNATPSAAEQLREAKRLQAIKIDLSRYPISIHGHFEYKFNKTALFYAWMAYLWQEAEGHRCGIKVKLVENNSIAIFSLNDFLDGDFSSFADSDYGDKPARLKHFFPRKLSFSELFLRASQCSYPFNPFQNYWRYFEKGDEFKEMVTYEFQTGIRTGRKADKNSAPLSQIIEHKNSETALKHLTVFTNQMIADGWEETFRPLDMPSRMYEHAFDFEIWTGINWSNEQTNRLPKQRLKTFEDQFGIQLPSSFFHYLRLLNGRQYNSHNMYFPIDDLYTVKVKKFYTIEELEEVTKTSIQKNPALLQIGELENGNGLGLFIDPQSDAYGKVALVQEENVQSCEYSFERFARCAQSAPVQAEIFAAQENDVEFLQKRLTEGWDYTTRYNYQDAVTQAAESNAHEALELLLQAGARLRDDKHRNMPQTYDEQTMNLLDKYQ